MGAVTQKTYQIAIELGAAQQNLAEAGKLLADLKTKAAAANLEQKETQQVYRDNAAALKALASEQKKLEQAQGKAAAGEAWVKATAALDRNKAEQQQLNKIVQESKIDFQDAKAAAEAAGAAVGQQAARVRELGGSVKDYQAAAKAAAQEFSPGTVGALGQEITQLETEFQNAALGSRELAQIVQQLAEKRSEVRKLNNEMMGLNPRAQGRAFTVFSQAAVAAFSGATVAAEAFGLSSENAAKAQAKIQAAIGILYSVEQLTKALSGENLALGKSIFNAAKGWLGFGTAAQAGSATARTALASTGIGVLVLAVGALIALFMDWGSQVKSSESTFTKYKASVVGGFEALLAAGKDWFKFWIQLFTLDWKGAVQTAKKAGADIAKGYADGRAGVIDEARRAEIKAEIEHTSRYVEVIKSRGEDTLALEVANAKRKIEAEKANSKEQLDAVAAYLVLKNQYLKRQADEERAQALARIDGLEKIEAANGRAAIEQQRQVLEERLEQQIAADELLGKYESAAQIQLLAEIQALNDAHAQDVRQKEQAAELARLDARIALRAAKGQEAYAQEVARAERELAFLKSAAQRDEAAIIAAESHKNELVAARAYELTQRRYALRLAELDAIISLDNTKGQDSYQLQVVREEQALAYMKQVGTRNLAAEVAQQSKIDNLKAAHAIKEAAEERAADIARLNARIALMQALGSETTELQVQLKEKELLALLAAATRNEAAIIAKEGEIQALLTQQAVQDIEKRRALKVEAFENEMTLLEKQGKDTLLLRLKFAKQQLAQDTDTSEKGLAQFRADAQKVKELEADLTQRGPDVGGAILQKVFNIAPEDVQRVKGKLNEAFAELGQAVSSALTTYFTAGTAEAEAQIQAAQDKLSQLDNQLSAASSKRQQDEEALQSATGAKRDYLIKKVDAERAAEGKLAAQKAQAAREQEAAQKEKAKLEKQQQQITAATTAGEALLLGIRAAAEVVDIASKGKFGVDNIALAIAGAATIAASIFAVKNAVSQFEAGTGSLGSDGVLRGPRHAQGGIALFSRSGHFYGEAEGGEAITPVDASSYNAGALALIRTVGRTRQLTPADFAEAAQMRVLPPPSGYFAAGTSALGTGRPNVASSVGQVLVNSADLSELLTEVRELKAHAAVTAQATTSSAISARISAEKPPLVPDHETALAFEQKAKEAHQSAASATL